MKTKEINKNSGITLIALVVTILIILILAGVTIATLTGHNGIIKNATSAKQSSEKSSIFEQINIATKSAVSTKTLKINEIKFKQALTNNLGQEGTAYTITGNNEKGWIVTSKNHSFIINEEAKIWDVEDIEPLKTSNTKTNKTIAVRDQSNPKEIFFLPENFKIASDSALIIDEGIVVEDEDGNQFVWVPVPDVIQKKDENGNLVAPTWNDETPKASYTPMATTYTYADSSVKGTLYRGMLYDFEEVKDANNVVIGAKSIYNTNYNVATTNFREPSLVTGNNADMWAPMTTITGTAYDTKSAYTQTILGFNGTNFAQDFGKQMQEDYNEMVKSVNTYKGFYIGRYETGYEVSSSGNKTVSKNANTNLNVTTCNSTDEYTLKWYGLYKKQKDFSKNGLRSSMIWGSQFDAMMNWMSKTMKKIGSIDENKSNKETITGKCEYDIINNIYDLYGCHFEWCMEAYGNFSRGHRGGSFYNSRYPASHNYSAIGPYGEKQFYGSRLTLHIVE